MSNMTFKTKLLLCFLTVIVVSMLVPGWFVWQTTRNTILYEAENTAENEAVFLAKLAAQAERDGSTDIWNVIEHVSQAFKSRVTRIDMQGRVQTETGAAVPLNQLDNHADRVEVIEAREHGIGRSVRYSQTLERNLIYVAVRVDGVDGKGLGFVRVAMPLESVLERIAEAEKRWLGVLALAAVLAVSCAMLLCSHLDRSLAHMVQVVENLSAQALWQTGAESFRRARLHVLPGRDFEGLARAVNEMADHVDAYLHDIARHEAQLRAILYAMSEGVFVLGKHGRITLANPRLTAFLPDAVDAVGKLPSEILSVPQVLDALHMASNDGIESSFTCELRPGMVVSVQVVRPASVDAADENALQAIAVFHDISELSRALTMRREFVANVSHDLRTPLTAITGYAETLEQELAEPEVDHVASARFAGIILRNALHMSAMVEELLDLARLENSMASLALEPVGVDALLHEVGELCRLQLESRSLVLEVRNTGPAQIRADAALLLRAFRNLIDNAVQFAPEGSVVRILAEKAEEGGQTVTRFSVLDDGAGLVSQDVPRVFERFYRAGKDRSRVDGTTSTGLGLAICKHIVERHGGHIMAEAGPGGRFHFTIPFQGADTP